MNGSAVAEGASSRAVNEAIRAARAGYRPPPKLTISEFAGQEIRNPSGPLAGARWRNDFAPYQRFIMDAFHEPGVQTVVVMSSSQVGKTSILLNMIAYHIAHDPCPILVVQPTARPMAEEFSKNRVDALIRATPILRKTVARKRSRDSSNTVFEKTFRGGTLSFGGANSAASLASRPVRFLGLDEIERFPSELPGEGNTISIARARTKAYGRRRRVAMFSSPTIKGGPIDEWFEKGDQRRFYIPCPDCGVVSPYEWANVRWQGDDPSTARLHCPDCDYAMDDAERIAQLQDCEPVAENPDRRDKSIVSFQLSALYSPITPLSEIVEEFFQARQAQKAGDKSKMHTWQNTTLGEPVESDGEKVDHELLTDRVEPYAAEAPMGVAVITAGVDVQDDRLEGLVVGYGIGEESWLIDRWYITGSTDTDDPWDELEEKLTLTYRHENGQDLPIIACCIDSGHRTTKVYEFVRKHAARCYATKGRDGPHAIFQLSPKSRGRGRRNVDLYHVGADDAKRTWMDRFKLEEPGPGYVHIPDLLWADDELAKSLTAEKLVTRHSKGRAYQRWEPHRRGNEMLDAIVLSTVALKIRVPRAEELRQIHERLLNPELAPKPQQRSERVNPVTGRPVGSHWRRR